MYLCIYIVVADLRGATLLPLLTRRALKGSPKPAEAEGSDEGGQLFVRQRCRFTALRRQRRTTNDKNT